MEQTIDLKEYIRRVELLRRNAKDIILNEDFYVFRVDSDYGRDEVREMMGCISECFTNPELIFKYIHDESMSNVGIDENYLRDEAAVRDCTYYTVTGYVMGRPKDVWWHTRNKDDDLCEVFCADLDIYGNVIKVHECCFWEYPDNVFEGFLDRYDYLKDERDTLRDWYDYFKVPDCVKLPYKPGDILFCDARPYEHPYYCIYMGYDAEEEDYRQRELSHKSEWAYKDGDFEQRHYFHKAVRYSVDHNRLRLDALGRCDCSGPVMYDCIRLADKDELRHGWIEPWVDLDKVGRKDDKYSER